MNKIKTDKTESSLSLKGDHMTTKKITRASMEADYNKQQIVKALGKHPAQAIIDLIETTDNEGLRMQGLTALLDRVVPKLKPIDAPLPEAIALAGNTPMQQLDSLIAATLQGQLTIDQANSISSLLSLKAKLIEQDELIKRIEALEVKHG
jgi:hypothetical protein